MIARDKHSSGVVDPKVAALANSKSVATAQKMPSISFCFRELLQTGTTHPIQLFEPMRIRSENLYSIVGFPRAPDPLRLLSHVTLQINSGQASHLTFCILHLF
jgi:hypothetical protein